jgi:hypothetical protein
MQHFTNIPLVKLNGKWISGNTLVIGPNGNTFLASDLAASGTFPSQVISTPNIGFGTHVISTPNIGFGTHVIGTPVMMSQQQFTPHFGLQPMLPPMFNANSTSSTSSASRNSHQDLSGIPDRVL